MCFSCRKGHRLASFATFLLCIKRQNYKFDVYDMDLGEDMLLDYFQRLKSLIFHNLNMNYVEAWVKRLFLLHSCFFLLLCKWRKYCGLNAVTLPCCHSIRYFCHGKCLYYFLTNYICCTQIITDTHVTL